MIKRILCGLLGAIPGYACGAVLGYFMVEGLSSNTHDRSVEAAMTGAFVFGPLVAVVAFIVGCVLGGRKTTETGEDKTG